MTPVARTLVSIFVLALLLLAGLGSFAQERFMHQAALLRAKDAAIVEVAVARSAAASVNGPLAITHWARERGMVSAPDAPDAIAVAPSLLPPPTRTLVAPSLEVRTVWR